MKKLFYSFKKKKDLNLIANEILSHISERWVVTKDFFNDDKVYKPLGYNWYSIDNLRTVLPQHDLKDLKYAINLLVANYHVEKLNANDWLQIRVAALESGEEAYRGKFYIKMHKEMRAKNLDSLQKRYRVAITVIAFIIGSILAPLFIEWIKHIFWQN
jgi:hypothetical protein